MTFTIFTSLLWGRRSARERDTWWSRRPLSSAGGGDTLSWKAGPSTMQKTPRWQTAFLMRPCKSNGNTFSFPMNCEIHIGWRILRRNWIIERPISPFKSWIIELRGLFFKFYFIWKLNAYCPKIFSRLPFCHKGVLPFVLKLSSFFFQAIENWDMGHSWCLIEFYECYIFPLNDEEKKLGRNGPAFLDSV